MAEVATKKSINVVSSKKNEVCGVQSNNGLIDLDDLTTSNTQLISLCDDDDLVLTNNTRNELENDDKSLQELIESELALRICSSKEDDDDAVIEETENVISQPETIKKIVLDCRQDPVDVNAEFIAAESGHYSLVEEPYGHRNGHVSPQVNIEVVKPEPVRFHDEEEDQAFVEQPEAGVPPVIIQKTNEGDQESNHDEAVDVSSNSEECQAIVKEAVPPSDDTNSSNVTNDFVDESNSQSFPISASCPVDKYQWKEELVLKTLDDVDLLCTDVEQERKNADIDIPDSMLYDPTTLLFGMTVGRFHNFDEEIYLHNPNLVEEVKIPWMNKESSTNEHIDTLNDSYANNSVEEEEKIPTSPIRRDKSSISETIQEVDLKLEDSRFSDDVCQSEMSAEMASTQEFLDIERRVLNEEIDQEPPQIVISSEIAESQATSGSILENESPECLVAEDTQNLVDESSSEFSASDSTFIEKTEIVVSDTRVMIFSETRQLVAEQIGNLDSWTTVEEATKSADAEELQKDAPAATERDAVNDATRDDNEGKQDDYLAPSSPRAPLATPDETETSDVSNACDSESREETVTTSSTVVTSSKGGTKTKKKKIEGVAGNDATSPNLTPRTKKTKKSKKSDLEKENISVNCSLQDASMHTGTQRSHSEMIDFSAKDDLSNVNVKSLTQNYVSETSRSDQEKLCRERIATGVSIKQLCRSFGDISNMSDGDQATFGKANHTMEIEEKARSMGDLRVCEQGYSRFTRDAPVFARVSVKALRASYCSLASLTNEGKDKDRACEKPKLEALSKKVLHVRSVDAGKVQQQLNAVGQNADANTNCRSCGKVVFQMEQTKAEGLVWHKNCFRCVQCSKQLNVDNYESHESKLYCKPHFKELFQPKPVEESDQPVRPRKPELIIRENEPKELPPDVVRASDKPDLGLEELSSLNVKSRFQVFEKASTENTNEIERSPSQIAVKRSPSILSKLAKFQAKGMDIGVADESLNGIPYEESSESEDEVEAEETEEVESEIVKSKRTTRERPISFSKMDDIKNRWESTSQQGRREVQREARKEEIAGIRSRLFLGKQGKMKEMYQQAVAGSDRVTKINAAEEIQHSTTHARSLKERFERGEPIAASDDETDSKLKPEKADEEVIAAAKTGRPVTPVHPKTPTETSRRARDAFMGRQVSDDVVRSSDATEEIQVETSEISNKFKFFESYKEPEKQRKQFRITPPRDGQVKMDSPDREIYRDPDVVRADDRVDEVVRTDTARKMLSIFRQMEENACKEELPEGPKPLKRFTPPPEDKFAKATASDSEEGEDEEGEETDGDESAEERDPNYVRASDKVEDEFLKQAQNAARAKTLRAKFEHWEETDGKISNHHVAEMEMAQGTGEQSSIESASSLRARFESLGSQANESPRTPKVKVNRFVEIQTTCTEVCESCEKKVYPLEKVETNNKIFHKQCFRCLQCNCILRMDSFTLNNGKLYCIPHFKQLFITRGNYDEGFGVDPHKNKWATTNSSNSTSPSPIAVSNGDL
ncbi:LIM domain and actin-binding protein 1 [Acromyrmex echinatior]|uniref:LIM domain and actin-binding protein 1 n=1 Tax=Acromyrmex echinatior TaxID=103372 RepID=F4WEA4_ACREC|nr:LIM domain and actin-binding protein 1 [Acromyrmex echinatior]